MSGRQAHKWKQQKLDDEQKLLDQRYEDYRKERELLVNLEQNVYDGYEKTILTLSASFLAFSVSFLGIMKSKVNPGHTPVPILATIVLYRAWISFEDAR